MSDDDANAERPNLLKGYLECIEELQEEAAKAADGIKSVYAEAKANGFDVATLKALVKERSKDPAQRTEAESLLDLYRQEAAR